MHYEIEIREHDHGSGPGGQRWAAFKAFGTDGIARPLTFESPEEPRDYAYRNPCLARIVEVADDGGRVPADTTLP
jgi:hypothetical protein